MRLDFNVLWVDDQPDAVEAQSVPLTRKMEEEGFLFKRTLCKSLDEVTTILGDGVFADEIDLVLVDWDLGANVHGEDVIAKIREAAPYRDIVFYSARKPAAELRKLVFDNGIEGVYCASREELIPEVEDIFESLIRKVLDLDHTRGIVMGATCDIDHTVNECLLLIYEKLDAKGQEALLAEALERVQEKLKQWAKQVEKIQANASMPAVLEAHVYFTSNDRLRMLKGLVEGDALKAHANSGAALGKYIKAVVPERNTMAHVLPALKGKSRTVLNAAGEELGVKELRELRRLILGFRQDFYTLLSALRTPAEADSSQTGPASTKQGG
jgi:hypothetical protein